MRGVFPLIARPLVCAWLLSFTGVFLELPISQLLYAPSLPPVSVAITDVAFRDRGHEHAIDLPGQTMISSVFSGPRRPRGDRRAALRALGMHDLSAQRRAGGVTRPPTGSAAAARVLEHDDDDERNERPDRSERGEHATDDRPW